MGAHGRRVGGQRFGRRDVDEIPVQAELPRHIDQLKVQRYISARQQ